MNRKKLTSLIVCLAMLICMLPSMSKTASASSYSRKLKPGERQTITVSPASHTIDITLSDGKNGSSVYGKPAWVSISSPNNSTYRVTVQINPNNTSRSGSIVFKKNNKTYELVITQNKNYLNVTPTSRTISAAAGSFSFSFSIGAGTPIVSSNQTWLTFQKGTNVVTVNYRENTGAVRSGTITLKFGNMTATCFITQSSSPWTSISDLQTTKTGSIYKDQWTDYRAAQLTNFFTALINGGDSTAKSILNKAKPMATCYWTCLTARDGYGDWEFNAGQKYYGTPYQQSGRYIGHGYTVNDLTTNAGNVNSYFYTRTGDLGPGYGTDCSGYASYLGGTPWVRADEFSGQTSYFTKITNSSNFVSNIKSGDVLHRSGHVLMVVSVYREDGKAKGIVLMESRNRTTASGRNIYVFYDNDEVLKKLFGGISLSTIHTYIKNVVWGGTETAAGRTLKHIGTVSDFVNSFGTHDLLSRK